MYICEKAKECSDRMCHHYLPHKDPNKCVRGEKGVTECDAHKCYCIKISEDWDE